VSYLKGESKKYVGKRHPSGTIASTKKGPLSREGKWRAEKQVEGKDNDLKKSGEKSK